MQLAPCSLIRFRLAARVYHVYRWGAEHPSPLHHPITGAQVCAVVGHWLTREFDEALHWSRMVGIYRDHAFAVISAQALTRAHFCDWLVDQITRRRFRLYEELPPMRRGQSFDEYARVAHVPVVAGKSESTLPPAAAPTDEQPFHVIPAPGGGEMKNEVSAVCPAPSFRSERVETITPEVRKWLVQYVPRSRWEGELGEEGGGGFLVTTTRVIEVKAGDMVYHYYGGSSSALSTWWFSQPYEGDPRVFAALPEKSIADRLVKARVKKPMTILAGIGAPRCSNKPGGPVQYLFPYQPARTTVVAQGKNVIENDFLELI